MKMTMTVIMTPSKTRPTFFNISNLLSALKKHHLVLLAISVHSSLKKHLKCSRACCMQCNGAARQHASQNGLCGKCLRESKSRRLKCLLQKARWNPGFIYSQGKHDNVEIAPFSFYFTHIFTSNSSFDEVSPSCAEQTVCFENLQLLRHS